MKGACAFDKIAQGSHQRIKGHLTRIVNSRGDEAAAPQRYGPANMDAVGGLKPAIAPETVEFRETLQGARHRLDQQDAVNQPLGDRPVFIGFRKPIEGAFHVN